MSKFHLFMMVMSIILASSCSEKIPMVNLGVDSEYYVTRMTKLDINSAFTGDEYRWILHRDDGSDSLMSQTSRLLFIAADEGTYDISFDIIDDETPYHHDFVVNVIHEEIEYSAYIASVIEFRPAPGQFVNDLPLYEDGDTYDDMLEKVYESIGARNQTLISLGAYGGYVTFAFDHTVVNKPGYDFLIEGNAFYELTAPEEKGGSAEPGIVYVSYDENCNGIADDEWYELAGSEYYKPTTLHDYSITYFRPEDGKIPGPGSVGYITDATYIKWIDSLGETGYVAKNSFHSQDYYPKWLSDDELTFTGTLLPQNAVDISGMGRYYVLYSYDWGYADNHPNEYVDLNSFDISWAVDKNGNPVNLPAIDFVRVMTGVNQYCGWIGETSTEISGARDLHIKINEYD